MFVLALSLIIVGAVYAWSPVAIQNDPLPRMPGTQPDQVTLEGPNQCFNCHSNYDPLAEPGSNWRGSMMAQSARDFIFWSAMTVAAQDSIWAVGNPNGTDLCERCHFPEGWLEGRSDPTNASLMTASDYDGVHCGVCHRMWDPFFETTYDGTREGDDWLNYWDETNLSDSPSQDGADATYALDVNLAQSIQNFNGSSFYTANLPPQNYSENGSGQYFMSDDAAKRASFADAAARHTFEYSRYHKSKYFCGTCHDVSNPILFNLSADPTNPLPSELNPAYSYFHVERTFSEFMLSAYGQYGGADTNQEFQDQGAPGITHAASCQDCHMHAAVGAGCDKNDAPIRPDESIEHPNSGVPVHDLTGGNVWVSTVLASAIPGSDNYNMTNDELLNQGGSILTLDLSQGEGIDPDALLAGADRARQQLQLAASILNTDFDVATNNLSFIVQNNAGHKLISGFPEGRRMFINIKAFDDGVLILEVNPYDYSAGTLKGLQYPYIGLGLPDPQSLASHEIYRDDLVYEMHPASNLTGEEESFHFVLATSRYKDNRIPPKGFQAAEAADRLSLPFWQGNEDLGYFSPEEYSGGYDQISITIPEDADRVEIRLYYQTTSREYIEFLRDEITGTGNLTLTSPTYSGEPDAYIIQSDPFFEQLKSWGITLWDLWVQNKDVEGAAPLLMASSMIEEAPTGGLSGVTFIDLDEDGVIDSNEWGLADWNLHLSGNGLNLISQTSSDGSYSFQGLPYGTYSISEEVMPGWDQTYPLSGSWDIEINALNEIFTELNFGNIPSFRIFLPLLTR